MSKLADAIRKYALANAYAHGGKAQAGAVLGKLIGAGLVSKLDIGKIKAEIDRTISEISKLSTQKQETELRKIYPTFFEHKEVKEELKDLPGAKGKIVTRIPPGPSKHLHIGHALSFFINYLYAKKYKGKCILRFEDTNPLDAKQAYVDSILNDLKYLKIKPSKTVYISDHLPKLYELASKLIVKNEAYVCFCSVAKARELRHKGEACECRSKSTNMQEWKAVLAGKYKEGEATLRLKIDMQSNNSAMRDPAIFKICKKSHYRQKRKYNVWPLYDFANAVMDALNGVTYVLRSSEFGKFRIELQNYIKKSLGFDTVPIIQYGRFEVEDAETSGRKIAEAIGSGKMSGWDDVRLVTVSALKRRGIVPETFEKLAIKVGLSKTPTKLDWELISSVNRGVVDGDAYRFFFVADPVEVKINLVKEVRLKIHPDKTKTRLIKVSNVIYVDRDDFSKFKGKNVRLKGLANVILGETAQIVDATETQTIHWVSKPYCSVAVLMPNNKWIKGVGEPSIAKIKKGEIVQFERFGFVKCEGKNRFVYGHR